MTPFDFALYVLVCLGVTYGFVESVIMAPWRVALSRTGVLGQTLAYCPSCTGFWVALGVASLWDGAFEFTWWTIGYAFAFIGVLTILRTAWPSLLLGAWGEAEPKT